MSGGAMPLARDKEGRDEIIGNDRQIHKRPRVVLGPVMTRQSSMYL